MNVWNLNSDWKDVKVSNYELNETIINDFCDSFMTEIRWIIMNKKMKMMCMKEKFMKTVTHHDTKTFKKQELKITDKNFRTMIRNVLMCRLTEESEWDILSHENSVSSH